MRKGIKKRLAILMMAAMVIGLMPTLAYADSQTAYTDLNGVT